jgi:hypothetical protein
MTVLREERQQLVDDALSPAPDRLDAGGSVVMAYTAKQLAVISGQGPCGLHPRGRPGTWEVISCALRGYHWSDRPKPFTALNAVQAPNDSFSQSTYRHRRSYSVTAMIRPESFSPASAAATP